MTKEKKKSKAKQKKESFRDNLTRSFLDEKETNIEIRKRQEAGFRRISGISILILISGNLFGISKAYHIIINIVLALLLIFLYIFIELFNLKNYETHTNRLIRDKDKK